MPVAVGLLLVAMAITTAALAAITLRLTSLVSTLLVTYLFYLANLGLVVIVLSPLELVTRGGLAVAEGVLLAAALAAWWLRGRPAPPLRRARAAARTILPSPVSLAFLVVVLVLLAYERAARPSVAAEQHGLARPTTCRARRRGRSTAAGTGSRTRPRSS